MTSCSRDKQELVAYLLGELDSEEARSLERHLEDCSACRRETADLKRVLNGAAAAGDEVRRAMETVDWEALPERIARKVFDRPESRTATRGVRRLFAPFVLRPAAAGLAAGIVLGALAAFLVFRPHAPQSDPRGSYYASSEFLDRIELELARRETLSYLDRSQSLIQDFLQPAVLESGGLWSEGSGQRRAASLLQKKKYINPQLERRQMAKAKDICDQIELLVLELAQIGPDLSDEDKARIQERVDDSRLWLKINLLKKELQDSEAANI
ncbi:MAG: zf-HC2 domain-containing protein [Candidatus Aminicenantes bacterium]|nr:zf-HC2 domain-containing protein [Candidatus Aminicenantes bacterium]